MKLCGNDGLGGWDCFMKISVPFINVSPLKKPNLLLLWLDVADVWPHVHFQEVLASVAFHFDV